MVDVNPVAGTPEWVQEGMEYAIRFMLAWGVPIEFALQTLRDIEAKLNERQLLREDMPDKLAFVFGAYFGETLRSAYGGRWAETEWGWAFQIEVNGNTLLTFPTNKVYNFLTKGSEDSFAFLFEVVGHQISDMKQEP